MIYRTTIVIWMLFFQPLLGFSQNIDSLKQLLTRSTRNEKCDILFRLVSGYAYVDNDRSLAYATQGYELSLTLGDSFRMVKAARLNGQAHRRADNLSESLKFFDQALAIAERNKLNEDFYAEYKIILQGIAITHTYLAQFDKALEYNYKALAILEPEGNKSDLGILYNNIGLVYYKLFNYKDALKNYNLALLYKKEAKDYYDQDRLLINIGMCNIALNNFKESLKNFEEAFTICKNVCSDEIKIEGIFGRGLAYYEMQNFSEALINFNEAYELSKYFNNKRFQAEVLLYLAKVSYAMNKKKPAIALLAKAETISISSGYNQLTIETYLEFANVYNNLKNFEKAAIYQQKYIQLKDSIYNEELTNNLMKVEAEYQERQNKATIASQEQILELKEEVIQQQSITNIIIGCIAVLLIILAVTLYRSNRQKRMINKILDEKVKERTFALEQSQEALIQASKDIDLLIEQTSEDINSSLQTIKGICASGLQEISDPNARQYISQMNVTSDHLAFTLKNLQALSSVQ